MVSDKDAEKYVESLRNISAEERKRLMHGEWVINGFDAMIEVVEAVRWIKEYFDAQPHAKGAVIGLSGGKDSAVCAGLLVKALGKERVMGVSLPNGDQPDIMDAKLIADTLGIEYKVVNINAAYSRLHDNIEAGLKEVPTHLATINMLPRIRMTVLYAISATKHYRVCGTGNLSEDFVGYATKWGDLACDFNPIQYFTTDEVVALGDELGLPKEVVHKTPSDGICGFSDEANMGIQYDDINAILRKTRPVGDDIYKKIMDMHAYNQHKVKPIPCYRPIWVNAEL